MRKNAIEKKGRWDKRRLRKKDVKRGEDAESDIGERRERTLGERVGSNVK